MRNNRGFTLVELLAVIVILLSLTVATGWGITSALERRDEKECEELKELAIGAAKVYFSKQDVNVTEVTIQTLTSEGYFVNAKRVVERLGDEDKVKIGSDGYEYVFTIGNKCK